MFYLSGVVREYCTKVTYTERNICAVKGSTVDISSSYNTYGTIRSLLWFSQEQEFLYYSWPSTALWNKDRRVFVFDNFKVRSTLRITDLTESDSDVYKFSFTSSDLTGRHSGHPGVTLTVSGTDELTFVLIGVCILQLSVRPVD